MKLGAVWVMILSAGCASTARRIRGPDGEDNWFAITCRGSNNCYERAGEECPDGYVVADRTGAYGSVAFASGSGSYEGTATETANGYATSGTFSGHSTSVSAPIYKGEMIIKCGSGSSDRPSARVQREEAQEDAVAQAGSKKDLSQCSSAFDQVDDLAKLWAEWFDGEPLDHLGGDGTASRASFRGAFLRLCGDIDDDAQLCLNVSYARGHSDACMTSVKALPARSQEGFHHLFLRPKASE